MPGRGMRGGPIRATRGGRVTGGSGAGRRAAAGAGRARDPHAVEQVLLDPVLAGGDAHLEQLGDPALEPGDLRGGEVVVGALPPVAADPTAREIGRAPRGGRG